MEPRARAEEEVIADVTRFRWRLFAACMLLFGLAMTQSPGLLVADTKLDLAVAPLDFLARAAHLWDGEGAFGQLQNQAYGYLWPMGPFFALGSVVDLPGWVVQRLWMALVLCVAFVGTAKIARALGVRSDLSCLVAAAAYAISPRMLTVIGPSSIEVWPMALVPWVLLPLIVGAERGSPRQAAALSALAIAMVGGVNAAATSAVLPLGAIWLFTRSAGPRRRQMMIWWPVFTLLGTLWWLVPLFILGSYSPPFLDFIESAGITTFPTTLFDAARGTSNWVPYVQAFSPAGDDLLRVPFLVLNTSLLVVAGVAGLVLARNAHRRFLLAGVLAGLFLVTMGHTGSVQGLFAAQINDALDLALAPLRNVHKFDPVLRLPLVVGLAFTLEEGLSRRRTRVTRTGARADRVTASVLVASVMVSLAAASSPVLVGNLAVRGGFEDIPGYWRDTAAWLGEERPDGLALLVPGSSSGTYVWGEPREEPMQPLASTSWAVRNAVPLVPAGNIRMLDRIEQELARGVGGPGLGDYLARAGVTHLVLRNDLKRSDSITDSVLVHEAIDDTPALRRVAQFGPEVGGAPFIIGKIARALVSGGWQSTYPAVEVYEVRDPVARSTGTDSPPTVVGGPEDLLDVQAAGLIGSEATVLAPDADETQGRSGPLIVTDGLRSVERNFGRLTEAVSATLGAGSEPSLKARVLDYRLQGHDRWTTVARLDGASVVTATSSAAGSASAGGSRPGEMPYAAIDDDPSTSWVSAPLQTAPQSWRVEFDEPVSATAVSVTLGPSGGSDQLRLRAGTWTSPDLEFDPGETRRFEGPDSVTELVLEDVSGRTNNKLDIAEVEIGDTRVRRELVVPEVPREWGPPDAILLRRLGDARTGCAEIDGDVRCRAKKVGSPEEPRDFSRVVTLGDAQELEAALTVRPRGGPDLTSLIQAGQAVVVDASATALADPRASVTALVDGDPGTTWTAPANDITPTVEMRFLAPQMVRGLGLSVDQSTAARRPERLLMTWPEGKRTLVLDEDGAVSFPAIRTSRLSLRVLEAEPASDIDFDGSTSTVPVGISELVVQDVPFLPLSPSTRRSDLGCGSGPDVTVNGRTVRTSVTASARELFDGAALPAQFCGGGAVDLRAGENTLTLTASEAFVADRLVLGSARTAAALDLTTTEDSGARDVDGVTTGYVATRENANPGWKASSDGVRLVPQVFDGWRQGWRTQGHDSLTQRFAPDGPYRAGLAAGLAALLVLLVISAVFWRRPGVEHPPATELAGRPLLCTLTVAGLVLLISGWAGLVIGAVGWGAAALVRWLRPAWEGWGVALGLTFAVLAYVWGPWQSSSFAGRSAWPHYLVVLTLAAASCWVATEPFPRRARDIPGRSTSQ